MKPIFESLSERNIYMRGKEVRHSKPCSQINYSNYINQKTKSLTDP